MALEPHLGNAASARAGCAAARRTLPALRRVCVQFRVPGGHCVRARVRAARLAAGRGRHGQAGAPAVPPHRPRHTALHAQSTRASPCASPSVLTAPRHTPQVRLYSLATALEQAEEEGGSAVCCAPLTAHRAASKLSCLAWSPDDPGMVTGAQPPGCVGVACLTGGWGSTPAHGSSSAGSRMRGAPALEAGMLVLMADRPRLCPGAQWETTMVC